MPSKRRTFPGAWLTVLLGVFALFMISDFACRPKRTAVSGGGRGIGVIDGDSQELLVTGYCNCGKCCGWRKRWYFFGEPVYRYGKLKGLPKKVGVTASGKIAAKGTIAADTSVYPFGTKMEIPGYGEGTVQDVGGAIKGAHIDIWFASHEEALAWGSRKIKVKVAKPKK